MRGLFVLLESLIALLGLNLYQIVESGKLISFYFFCIISQTQSVILHDLKHCYS